MHMPTATSAGVSRALHFDLTSLRLFVATAELGSITAAATLHHVAVTAASRRISELEDQFGVALFKRERYGMSPTEAGSKLLAHAREMLRACQAMHLDADAFAHGDKGVVRIAACTSAVLQFLPAEIREFQYLNPDIRIDLQESDSQTVADAVVRGRADIGVLVGGSTDAGLRFEPYRQDEIVLAVPCSHHLAMHKSVSLEQALAYDFVGLPDGTAVSRLMQRIGDQHGAVLRTRIRVASFASMLAMISAGMGIGLIPRGVIDHIAGDLAVTAVPFTEAWSPRDVMLCYKNATALSAHAQQLLRFLAAFPAAHPSPP
jgi:DNA-binding transcriptional LysR family regulator